jgi:hypothetical protein
MGNEPLGKFSERRSSLAFRNPHFTFGERRPVSRFNLPGRAGIALFRAGLNVLAVKEEVIPVDITAFEYGHLLT